MDEMLSPDIAGKLKEYAGSKPELQGLQDLPQLNPAMEGMEQEEESLMSELEDIKSKLISATDTERAQFITALIQAILPSEQSE